MRRLGHCIGIASVGTLALLVGAELGPEAIAAEAAVDATMSTQLYDVVSPYGEPIVRRRRYTHTLGLNVSDLDGSHAYSAPELTFRTRMRLDADMGQDAAERDSQQLDRYIPGLQQAPFDLMYGFLEGRHFLGGVLGFRLGRQYQIDGFGWWSFDGALVRLDAPRIVGLEVYGGFEQRGGLQLLATSRFEADGVLRGHRGDLERNEWPFYLEQSALAPAYGLSLQSLGLGLLQARLAYRKVINRDQVLVSPFPDENGDFRSAAGNRTSTERALVSLVMQEPSVGAISGEAVTDLYVRRVSDVNVALDWYATEQSEVGVGYEYYVPTFDADSIFNWFVQWPTQTVELRGSTVLSPRVDLSARTGISFFQTGAEPTFDAAGGSVLADRFVALNARYRLASTTLRLDTEGRWGDTGHLVGGNLTTERKYHAGYYDSLVVLSLYDLSDAQRTQRDAVSAGYVLGGGIAPELLGIVKSRLGLEWEHLVSRLVGHRFRMLVTLNISELR